MKNKHVAMTVAVTAVALTAIACGSGSSGTKSTVSGGKAKSVASAKQPQATTAKVGQTVNLSSDDLGDKTAITVTVTNPKQYTKEPGEFGSKPDHGVFLVLDVTVTCTKGTYSADPLDFGFVSPDGTVSDEELGAMFDNVMDATDLASGQKVSGKIVFDVKKADLTGGKIQIQGVGLDFDKPAAYWTL